jgi:xanthine/uracil permease
LGQIGPNEKFGPIVLKIHHGASLKKSIITGSVIAVLGLLISLGPQFLFKVCSGEDTVPKCQWTAQAEIGLGMLIAALGLCLIVFNDEPKTQLGILIGIFFSSIIVLFIPHVLIGGCTMMTMACRRVAFPVITVIAVILLITSATYAVFTELKNPARIGC